MNKDFYDELPGFVCDKLEALVEKYGDEPWIEEAFEKYRQHVLTTEMDDVRIPGFIFKEYIDK